MRALGFRELRVRHLGEAARVEIAPRGAGAGSSDAALRAAVLAAVRSRRLRARSTIDPEGYRRGRLNEALRVVARHGLSGRRTGI